MDAHSYKIKRIKFFGREGVPVFTQNLNGPCPLLAIANILSLRNQLVVQPNTTSLSEARLISLVAEAILDSNTGRGSTEYEANLRQNIADCLEVLNKLATGIDVNVRFHSPHAFEPTPEVAIFDLLDISLVHGWIVDPYSDAATVLGKQSYNELVELLCSTLDVAELSRMASNTSLQLRHFSSITSNTGHQATAHVAHPQPQAAQQQQQQPAESALLMAEASSAEQPQVTPSASPPAATTMAAAALSKPPSTTAQPSPNSVGPTLADMLDDLASGMQATKLHESPVSLAVSPATGTAGQTTANGTMHNGGLALQAAPSAEPPTLSTPTVPTAQAPLIPLLDDEAPSTCTPVTMAAAAKGATGAQGPAAVALSITSETTAIPPAPAAAAADDRTAAAAAHNTGSALQGALGIAEGMAPAQPVASQHAIPALSLEATAAPIQLTAAQELQDAVAATAAFGVSSVAHNAATISPIQPVQKQDANGNAVSALPSSSAQAAPEAASVDAAADTGKAEAALMSGPVVPVGSVSAEPTAAAAEPAAPPAAIESAASPAAASVSNSVSGSASNANTARLAVEAALIRDFLESTCTQLTMQGIVQMWEGLKDNQLAVFFRNNHFSTLFKFGPSLYLLVTDQGYLSEPSVVWERLDAVDGDTQMCGPDFAPYVAPQHAVIPGVPAGALEGICEADAAAIAAASAGASDDIHAPAPATGICSTMDADLALALQLQEEEEHAARQAEQLQLQQQQQQQQQQQPPQQAQLQHSRLQQQQQGQMQYSRQQQQLQRQQQQQQGLHARHAGAASVGRAGAPGAVAAAAGHGQQQQRQQPQEEESKCTVM